MEIKSKNIIRMLCFFWTHATCQKIYLLDLFDQKMTFTNSDPVCFIVAFAKSIILCYQRPASLFYTIGSNLLWVRFWIYMWKFYFTQYFGHFMIDYDSSRIFFEVAGIKVEHTSNRFCTHCAKFWFFVPAWFTCCHLDFCKLCVSVPCKAL